MVFKHTKEEMERYDWSGKIFPVPKEVKRISEYISSPKEQVKIIRIKKWKFMK
tara:strand:- start:2 stop:160 length:159 start_codon:yes stop_codon:yes gene_type:complete